MFATPEDFEAAMASKTQAMATQTRAQARRIAAQAGLLELAGWSGVIAASGLAIWLGCLGLVSFQGESAKLQEAERAFIERVANAPVKVEVVAKLADGSQVRLASGGEVALAKGGMVGVSPDATVGLDPSRSTVRAVSDAPRPTPAPASGAAVKTDVVQFTTVSYGKGAIQSGWEFTDADAKAPARQWCLYTETGVDGTGHDVSLGHDGHRANLPTPSPFPSVDLLGAFASCVWWDSRTPASAKAPAKPVNQAAPSSPRVISARAKG
jgi:hypothetical protein